MSRTLIWTIVGILVVLGVIFIVTQQKERKRMAGTEPLTKEAFQTFISAYKLRVERLGMSITNLKTVLNNPTPEIQATLDELDTKFNALTTAYAELTNLTNQKEREDAIKNVRTLASDITKLLRSIGATIRPARDSGR